MKTRAYLILMAVAILLPVIVFSSVGLAMLLDWERESRLRSVQESARAAALVVDQEIVAAEAALRILSHSAAIQSGDFRSLHRLMTVANKTRDAWTVLSDERGKPLVNSFVDFGTPLPQHGSGDWAAEVIDKQRATVSNYFIGTLAGEAVIAVNVPTPEMDGKRYVISQIFKAAHFNNILQNLSRPPSWTAGIFGSDGVVIARSHKGGEFIGKPVQAELLEASRMAFSGMMHHPDQESAALYEVFTHPTSASWTVSIGVPSRDIEEPARRAALYAAFALAATFALALLAGAVLARRLAGALQLALAAARELGQGRIPERENPQVLEIGMLQSALHDAGMSLAEESASRRRLQEERERLLCSEQEARKLAEAQNRAKDEFLAMLGHELRNPLAAVAGAFAVMEAANASPEQRLRALRIGGRQTGHLSRIVDDLLDVGRIMAGKIELRREAVELGGLVARCIEAQRASDRDRHAWHIDITPVWIDADATRFEQIITNLLTNAVKFTPPGRAIHVTVQAEGGHAVAEIRDAGIGISPELLPAIFDVFVQGPTTIDRSQGGLGLGLALVRRLIDLHGGTVAASSPGRDLGSCFRLQLPQPRQPSASRPAGGEPMPVGRHENLHVLVVEDNDDGRDMLSAMLGLHGFRVTAARDGEEALRLAAAEWPDAALIDIGLPGISGYELARRLRQHSAAGIRLIALTGYGLDEDRRNAAEAGFSIHLTKPYSSGSLLSALTRPGTDTRASAGGHIHADAGMTANEALSR